MESGIWLVLALIGGGVSLAIASSKNRNGLGWFVFGFLFPLIAIIAIACLPAITRDPEAPPL